MSQSEEQTSSGSMVVSPCAPEFTTRLVMITVLALILHVWIAFVHFPEPAGDAAEYDQLAVNVVTGRGFALGSSDEPPRPTARRMPLYPLFLASLYALSGSDGGWMVVPIIQALLMACNVALTMAIARRFFSEAGATWAGVLMCLYQANLALPGELLSENLYITLLLTTLFLLSWQGARRNAARVGAFAVLGLLILTRANALVMAPLAYVWLWRIVDKPKRRKMVFLSTVCFVAVLTPWCVRNAVAFGRFIPTATNGGWNFYLGHNEQYSHSPGLASGTDYGIFDTLISEGYSEVEADHELYRRGLSFAWEHPWDTVRNSVRKVGVLFSTHWRFNWTMLILAVAGVGICCLARRIGAGRQAISVGILLVAGAALAWIAQLTHMQFAGLGVTFEWIGPAAILGAIVAFRRSSSHWLLLAMYLAHAFAALVFIPLARIRWSVDVLAIMYASVTIAAVCSAVADYFCGRNENRRKSKSECR